MPNARALLPTLRGWRAAVLVAGLVTVVAAAIVVPTVSRLRAYTQEIRTLRGRLAEKREIIQRQQAEMAQVSDAVDRLVRAAVVVRERNTQARRLAHMEESRAPETGPVVTAVTVSGGRAPVSQDAANALEELTWLDGQLAATSDSIAVLTALLTQRPARSSSGSPTLWPVRGLVTSTFGTRLSPYGGGREMHPGVDIQAQYGLPVTASGDGEVVYAGRDPGYGNCVVIDHGQDVQTLYGHLSAIFVREHQHVRRGDPLGALGASGRATGVHLHYEMRVAGQPVDPLRYLRN